MGKCKFSQSWLQDASFKDWPRPDVGSDRQAYCRVCLKMINVNWMGANGLRSHMKAEKHMSGRGQQQTLTTSTVCSASTTTMATPPLQQHKQTKPMDTFASPTQVLRILLGGNATLRAETLWCLNTSTKHQSLNYKQGIGELFGVMFPDSYVASSK